MRYWLCAALVVIVPFGSAAAVDFAALAAGLDSEQFDQRDSAEQALLEGGLKIVSDAFAAAPLPQDADDDQVDRHFAKLQADIRSALEKLIYRHLDGLTGTEARFRAQRLREMIDRQLLDELARAQVGLSRRLPEVIAEKVFGYTGGFRDGTTWFDAQFGNNSQYTVTSIRILVRLTHKETGAKTERQIALTSKDPLHPGEKAVWSADVGMAQTSNHEFFWDTLAIFGVPPDPLPNADIPPRSDIRP